MQSKEKQDAKGNLGHGKRLAFPHIYEWEQKAKHHSKTKQWPEKNYQKLKELLAQPKHLSSYDRCEEIEKLFTRVSLSVDGAEELLCHAMDSARNFDHLFEHIPL